MWTRSSWGLAPGSRAGTGADRPTVVPEFERGSSFLYLDYDVNDNVTVFLQGIYGTSVTTSTNLAGQFQSFFSPMTIYSGNAFLPASIQQIMDDNNIASFTLNRMGNSADLGSINPTNVQDITLAQKTIGLEAELNGEKDRLDSRTIDPDEPPSRE